jgi:peptidoglycan/LPS O-acetylase OafA/YrhL
MGIVRLLLALAVVSTHAGPLPLTGNHLVGGIVAVQSFYVISGFYMALVLHGRYRNRADFYFNRFLRLYPTYWCVLGLAALLGSTTFHAILTSPLLKWDGKALMLFANLFIFGSDAMLFLFPGVDGLQFTADFRDHGMRMLLPFHAIPQAWTLPIEMMFYAVAPFIVKDLRGLLAIVVASLALRYVVYTSASAGDPWTYRFFPLELAFFCAGSIAFHVYNRIRELDAARWIGAVLLIVIVGYMIAFDDVPVLLPDTLLFDGQMLQFYALLLASLPFIFHASRASAIDQWIGELSYPVYLVHLLVIGAVLRFLPEASAAAMYWILALTLLAAALLNIAVQLPIERRFKRLPRLEPLPAE